MGKDLFRDTKVRYLGYANEIGEALRPVIPGKFVRYSYGIAFGYVLADTIDKAFNKLRTDGRPTKVLWATGDTLIWQGLASIVLPGIAINRIVFHSDRLLTEHIHKVPQQLAAVTRYRAYMPVAIGLMSIPIIVYPIDLAVHGFMNITYRLFFH